jgi:hypothetical protein
MNLVKCQIIIIDYTNVFVPETRVVSKLFNEPKKWIFAYNKEPREFSWALEIFEEKNVQSWNYIDNWEFAF